MEGPPLLARQPQAVGCHPLADGLPAHLDAVPFLECLLGQRRSEVAIVPAHQLQRILSNTGLQMVVRGSAASPMDQRTATTVPVPDQQSVRLAIADRQHRRSGGRASPPGQNYRLHFDALQILRTHRYQAHPLGHFNWQRGDISTWALHTNRTEPSLSDVRSDASTHSFLGPSDPEGVISILRSLQG